MCQNWKIHFVMEKNQRRFAPRNKIGSSLFAVLVNSLLSNWQGRIKFVDDTSALEIVPRCSPSLLPVVVDEVNNFATDRGMKLNPKKCREMLISFKVQFIQL